MHIDPFRWSPHRFNRITALVSSGSGGEVMKLDACVCVCVCLSVCARACACSCMCVVTGEREQRVEKSHIKPSSVYLRSQALFGFKKNNKQMYTWTRKILTGVQGRQCCAFLMQKHLHTDLMHFYSFYFYWCKSIALKCLFEYFHVIRNAFTDFWKGAASFATSVIII